MSWDKEVKTHIEALFRSKIGEYFEQRDKVASVYEVGIKGQDESLWICIHCSQESKKKRSDGTKDYYFGYQKSLVDDYYFGEDDYMLCACGYKAPTLPERLYLLPFTLFDKIEVSQRKDGNYRFHIEVSHTSKQLESWLVGNEVNGIKTKEPIDRCLYTIDGAVELLCNKAMSPEDWPMILEQCLQQVERELSDDYTEIGGGNREEAIKKIPEYIPEYQRIVDSLKGKYGNRCQIESCGDTFRKRGGGFYSEGHHLVWRAAGGGPEAENVVVLCANHHRMFHYADVEVGEPEGSKREVRINGESEFIVY